MEARPSVLMAEVRRKVPLVHHITNYVTVNDCANICICAGGSPVMTDAIEDVPEMVSIASATVLNIGTLNPRTVESMLAAARTAKAKGIPVILDPVGAGATSYRTKVTERLMSFRPEVIKGNAGEIGVLSGLGGEVKGVDSHGSKDQAESTRALAERMGCVVASTGKVDYVSDGKTTLRLTNGSGYMEKVSGTGCMASSVVGCYAGACGATVESIASAITALNVAAEIAERSCRGPGTFKPALLDALDALDTETIDSAARWEEI